MKRIRCFLTIVCLLASVQFGVAQISVSSCKGKTPQQVVEGVIKGNGVKITNVKFNGSADPLKKKDSQLGTFTNNEKKFPGFFSSGIILCTGNCSMAEGPNNKEGNTSAVNAHSQKCKELENLVKPYSVNYPAVLEFDFSSVTEHVQFRYVFASEEYPEYSCSAFNDVFGFFVTDTKTGKTSNIALIPGTKKAVSVNNIHPDYKEDCKGVNEKYLTMVPDGSPKMQFDGYVGPLEAVVDLEPNRTYHIKLAISNVSDMQLESAVFIEAMSFNAVDNQGFIVDDKGNCINPTGFKTDTLPEKTVKGVPIEELEKGCETEGLSFEEIIPGGHFDYGNYDITAETEYDFLFDTVAPVVRGNSVHVRLHLRGGWCDCFVPEEVPVDVIFTPKPGSDAGLEKIVKPIRMPVIGRKAWFSRCFWVLIAIVALLLFVFYLRALLRKNRFKKSARIKYTFMEMKGSVVRESALKNGPKLREKGFGPWLKRWLVPFVDERRTILWTVPPAGSMTYVAAKSKNRVFFTKESFVPNKMQMGSYNPLEEREKLVEMDAAVKVFREKKYQGRLEFDSGYKNDEKYYRLIVIGLMVVSIVGIALLSFFMIRAII